MTPEDVRAFEWKVKHILDWSVLGPGTRAALEALMAEVAALARRS